MPEPYARCSVCGCDLAEGEVYYGEREDFCEECDDKQEDRNEKQEADNA